MSPIKVLCFGNEFLPYDSLAKKLADKMEVKGFEFIKCVTPEEIMNYLTEPLLVILDVVKDIDKTVLIEDLSKLNASALTTAHDFDLNFFLTLMTNFGKDLSSIKIVGIPMEGDIDVISGDVSDMLKGLVK